MTVVRDELDRARGQLGRIDTKASMYLALTGGGLALLATVGVSRPPWPVAVPAAVVGACVVAALWLLLTLGLPRLDGHFGISLYAQATSPDDCAQAATVAPAAAEQAELWWTAREARRRYRLMWWAVQLLRAALVFGVAAAVVAVVVA